MSLQGGRHGKSLRTLIRNNSKKLFIVEVFLGSKGSVSNTFKTNDLELITAQRKKSTAGLHHPLSPT